MIERLANGIITRALRDKVRLARKISAFKEVRRLSYTDVVDAACRVTPSILPPRAHSTYRRIPLAGGERDGVKLMATGPLAEKSMPKPKVRLAGEQAIRAMLARCV